MVIPASIVVEAAGLPQNAQMLHFCPAFFDINQLGRMEFQTEESSFSLDKLDSTARCLLHELTHLPWTLNTNLNDEPKDKRGWFEVITFAVDVDKQSSAQTPNTKTFRALNADNYAWMAIYNYFNSLDKCAGIRYTGENQGPSTCNADVWPQDALKPVKTTWNSWPGSN
ncbi:uncharacterized protein LY89DRAFT_738322 [Mollisia scopiformis]|uniref:Lysine-specific metallo-endopeptidase domain-containing protein n=1 Tax=Mollisia scopiformis TaxID=149040 RepID=A0A194WX36_MOLSC|nr:uncharacterized protein LY89DRAFT_738322 [Mollisia scopiformis]KUJ12546.1 hypothetical protein LY89DRAFT_738322 [Mollisia scopiformis]